MPRRSNPQLNRSVRLNKFLADCGVASRRKADELIDSGSVKVNGKTVYELGIKIDPKSDKVTLKGRPLKIDDQKVYLMFHKPKHILTSMNDPEGRPTIADFFKKLPFRLFPVGRLDWETEGLILLTNDGDFAQRVLHPKHEIPKAYLVKLNGKPSDEQLHRLVKGVSIIGGRVRAIEASRLRGKGSEQYDWIRIVISEGKNRQIRKMCEKIGFDVKKLQRISIGQLKLANLARGQHRLLGPEDLKKIFAQKEKKERLKSPKKSPTQNRSSQGSHHRAK
ncbi:MAG: rRNA pseudouridine synthase [Bdellovibrionales bacterium]|nr:rRNA pseudouridine synthase [Bdellovibrionales bacterium]